MSEKLQKALANLGLGSRREIETWIADGKVKVNNQVAQLGARVSVGDQIQVGRKRIQIKDQSETATQVLIYHKPEGEVCSRSDEKQRKTVFNNLPRCPGGRWIMVGRLDINSMGLLLFTNNGELANRLMHPKYEIEREYAVRVYGEVDAIKLKNLTTGVMLEDGMAKFDTLVDRGGEGKNHWYHVTLSEGRNREVRRLWETQDVKVSRLIRVRFGDLALPARLPRGKFTELSHGEVSSLLKSVDLKTQPRTARRSIHKQNTRKRTPAKPRSRRKK